MIKHGVVPTHPRHCHSSTRRVAVEAVTWLTSARQLTVKAGLKAEAHGLVSEARAPRQVRLNSASPRPIRTLGL